MAHKHEGEETAARNYVAVRLTADDYRALRLFATMERRSLGGFLESLLAKAIDERHDELDQYVEKQAMRAAQKQRKELTEETRAAA